MNEVVAKQSRVLRYPLPWSVPVIQGALLYSSFPHRLMHRSSARALVEPSIAILTLRLLLGELFDVLRIC